MLPSTHKILQCTDCAPEFARNCPKSPEIARNVPEFARNAPEFARIMYKFPLKRPKYISGTFRALGTRARKIRPNSPEIFFGRSKYVKITHATVFSMCVTTTDTKKNDKKYPPLSPQNTWSARRKKSFFFKSLQRLLTQDPLYLTTFYL